MVELLSRQLMIKGMHLGRFLVRFLYIYIYILYTLIISCVQYPHNINITYHFLFLHLLYFEHIISCVNISQFPTCNLQFNGAVCWRIPLYTRHVHITLSIH